MLFPSLNFVELAINGAKNRNIVVEYNEVKKLIPSDGADHYACLFRYGASLKRHTDTTGSVKHHDLPHYPDFITFDIDDPDDLENARQSTISLIEKLAGLGIDDNLFVLSFSGAKGFHIQIPSSLFDVMPDQNNAKHMRELCVGIANGIKIDTGIYDKNRLFRIRNTKNSKSGLYKVNLRPAMIFDDIATIKDYASKPQAINPIRNNHSARKHLSELWKKAQAVKERRTVIGTPFTVEVPRYAKACIHRIMQGVPNGVIHNAAFRVANHFFKQGFPANVIKGILEGWGPLNEIPAEEDFNRMAEEAGQYDFGCNDDVLSSFCSDQCYLFKRKAVDASDVMDFEAQYVAYTEYIRTLKQKCFVTGFEELDSYIRGVAPGEVLIIVAYSGNFKSAILQNILVNAGKRTGLHHLFFSLEMPVSRVFERSVQMTCEMEGYKIENSFKDSEYQKEIYDRMVKDRADRLLVCQKSGVSVEQIKEYTAAAREKYGDIGAIGIDYLGLMSAPGKQDEYSRISHCAENAKHLAKDLNVPVILLSQVNRGTAGGDVEKSSAKGSGAIEASADFLIGLQRDESDQLILKLLKNRKGAENIDFVVEMEREYLKFVSVVKAEKTEAAPSKVKRSRFAKVAKEKDDDDCPY